MIAKIPTAPPELLLPGPRENLLLEVGPDELRALNYFSRRYWNVPHNAADVAEHIFRVALANPESLTRLFAAGQRYASTEGISFNAHIKDKIRSHQLYHDCEPVLTMQ